MARFRFKSRQVRDPAAQQNFEQLEGELPKNWLQLAVPLAAGREVAFGTGSVTFAASQSSTTATVAHGLDGVPVVVLLTPFGNTAIFGCITKDATNITVRADYYTPVTITASFSWLAIA